ncbi:MAG TPA: ThuA domain-containing protein [Planctomycetota bacterium]|nr:ThuA domain-containing protein [Planctomycetota bacterium]
MRELLSKILGREIDPGAKLSLTFNQNVEPWLVLILGIGVVLFAIWVYRKDGRDTASPRLRAFLGVMRAGLIAIALLILAEPILVATQIETRRSSVIVLVDDSYSMDLPFADAQEPLRKKLQDAMAGATLTLKGDDGKPLTVQADKLAPGQFKLLTRLNVVSAAMENPRGTPFLDTLKKDHDVKFFGFARSISGNRDDGTPLDPMHLTSSNMRGAETRIGDSMRSALKEVRGQPLAGIVIITDGRQNAGEDALQAAQVYKTRNIPIFTVGIGDPSEPKDFEVTVEGPDVILPDDPSEVVAWVRYRGYTGITSIKVDMKDGDKVIASEEAKLGKPGEKTPVPLHFKESKPGKYTYVVQIPEQQGELRTDNNKATYNFQVVDKKVKVLFVEGQDLPRWEYRYLKTALRRDHTTECDVLLATSDNTFQWDGTEGKTPLEQFPINKKEISDYDVIIFGDVSPTIFTADQAKLLQEFIREGGGFMMIAGERYAPAEYTQAPWFEILPVIPQRSAYATPEGGFQEQFSIEPTPDGYKEAWMHLDPDEHANREIWENLPKMYWYYPVKKKKDLAKVLATHPTDKDETGAKMPLIVEMPYGSGKTMFIGVDSLWRWRRGVGDKYHYRFYNQAIRHLSQAKRLGGQKRFLMSTDRSLSAIGDKVGVTATVKDENLKELIDPRVQVHGKKPNGENFTFDLKAMHDRPGVYEGDYIPEAQGDYTIWMTDPSQPDAHQSEVTFKVEKPQLEFENPRLDEDLLKGVAKAGGDGGEYHSIETLNEIPPKIRPVSGSIPRESTFDLWDNWAVLLIFSLMITAEWILRKYGRMI